MYDQSHPDNTNPVLKYWGRGRCIRLCPLQASNSLRFKSWIPVISVTIFYVVIVFHIIHSWLDSDVVVLVPSFSPRILSVVPSVAGLSVATVLVPHGSFQCPSPYFFFGWYPLSFFHCHFVEPEWYPITRYLMFNLRPLPLLT